jgi:hypothetical protein
LIFIDRIAVGNLRPKLGIMIEDDEPRSRPKWERFPQLLNNPQTRWMLRDVEVQDASAVVFRQGF